MGQSPSIGRFGVFAVAAGFALLAALGASQGANPVLAAAESATACPERVGHWPFGRSFATAIDGDIAFFGVGTVLRVADVSSPFNPFVLSEIPIGDLIVDLEVSGDLLIAAISGSGVATVDIGDPANPVLLDTVPLTGAAYALAVVDGNALVGGDSFWVVDLSNPSNLTVSGTLDSGIASIRDLAVSGSVTVAADYNYGFHVLDVSNPSSPTLLATHSDDLDRPLSVDVSGNYAFLLESHDDIVVFDVSNPNNPSIVNRVDPDRSWFADLNIDADRLYVGCNSALLIYDIADPTTPSELWNDYVGIGGYAELEAVGSILYSAQYSKGLGILDVSTPSAPEYLTRLSGEGQTNQVALWDTYAATVIHAQGLAIFDMSDPTTPLELSRVDWVNPNDFVVRDGYAYTINPSNFDIVDLTDPSAPTAVANAPLGGQNLALAGDVAVLGGSSDGIRIVDIGNLSAPAEVALVDVDYTVSAVGATGPAFYVPEEDTGLHVFDITVPSAPVEAGLIPLPGLNNDNVEVDDGLLVVSEYGTGVRIFDVSNPLQPVETALYTGLEIGWNLEISDDMLVVGTRDEGLHVLDLSDPTTPVLLGESPLLADYPNGVAALGGVAMVGEEDVGFEVFDLEACALSPVAADFSWSPIQPWVGATVDFSDLSSGGITAWHWTFGDGGTSTEASPSHSYSAAGTYTVGLTITGPLNTDSVTKDIILSQDPPETPPVEQAGAKQWMIPAAAHSPGAQGTNWVSDVVIRNPASQDASANVYFLKSGQNNSGTTGRRIEIPGGTSIALDDIVQNRFGWSNASGAILIGCDVMLQISSRTYNNATSGTFGQFIPGLPVAEAAGTGDAVRLIQLTRSETFRTNIGWANPGGGPVVLDIDLLDAHGASIGSHQATIPPFGYGQANDILPSNVDDAMAVVSSNSYGAKFFVYGSVVDNSTGDPILLLEAENEAVLHIPATAHVQGLAGTDWKTDLEIANLKRNAVDCTVELLKTGVDNSMPSNAVVTVPGKSSVRVRDVLATLFDHEGSAALRLRTGGSEISATSSTYNTTAVGTYGQFISGTASDAAVVPGQVGVMIQLSQSAGNTDGYRTNLGLLNTTGVPVEVLIELFDHDGSSLGSGSTELMPYEHHQINRIFRDATSAAISNGVARVSTTTPNGAFFAYASVVDNRSGDPVYIPAWVR